MEIKKVNGPKSNNNFWFEKVDEDFDEIFYAKEYPDSLPFYANLSHISLRERLFNHYKRYRDKTTLFKNPKEKEKVWTAIVDEDFDEIFYAKEYPDSLPFYANLRHISLRERLFNHYKKFGIKMGLFKNSKQKDVKEIDNTSVSIKISLSDFSFKQNNLECVCLLLTDKELQTGLYDGFFKELQSKTRSCDVSFKIISNKKLDNNKLQIAKLNTIFKDVEVINLDLSQEEDLYIKDNEDFTVVPSHGTKSGPNIMFFESIKLCQKYNTTLFLETDCFFKFCWLDKIKKFVEHSNGFWVSGGLYDGLVPCKASSIMATHINGGTALYATGDKNFQTFMESARDFVLKQVKNGDHNIAYDYAIKMFIDYNINNAMHQEEDVLLWKLISRQYLPNKLIGNFSTIKDKDLSIEQIDRIYNYYIIHKKI